MGGKTLNNGVGKSNGDEAADARQPANETLRMEGAIDDSSAGLVGAESKEGHSLSVRDLISPTITSAVLIGAGWVAGSVWTLSGNKPLRFVAVGGALILVVVTIWLLRRWAKNLLDGITAMRSGKSPYKFDSAGGPTTNDLAEKGKAFLRKIAKAFLILVVLIMAGWIHLRVGLGHVMEGFWLFISREYPERLLAPTAVAIAASVAWFGYRQKRAADRKAEWWKRTQYAMDSLVAGKDESIAVGSRMIDHLLKEQSGGWLSRGLADKQDRVLFESVALKLSADIAQSTEASKLREDPKMEEAENDRSSGPWKLKKLQFFHWKPRQ